MKNFKAIFIEFFLNFFLYIISLDFVNASYNGEGWEWKKTFQGVYRDQGINFDNLHEELASQEFDIFENLAERTHNKICKSNVVLASLSLIIWNKETGELISVPHPLYQEQKPPNPFAPSQNLPLAFISESAFEDRGFQNRLSQNLILKGYAISKGCGIEEIYERLSRKTEEGQENTNIKKEVLKNLQEQINMAQNSIEALSRLTNKATKDLGLVFSSPKSDHEKSIPSLSAIKEKLKEIRPKIGELKKALKTCTDAQPRIISEEERNRIQEIIGRVKEDLLKKKLHLEGMERERELNDNLNLKAGFNHTEQKLFYHLENHQSFENLIQERCRNIILEYGKDNISFLGAIFHLHSRLDICERCAPMISLELDNKQEEMLAHRVISELKKFNPENFPDPTFHICASVRQELTNSTSNLGYRRRQNYFKDSFHQPIDLAQSSERVYMRVISHF